MSMGHVAKDCVRRFLFKVVLITTITKGVALTNDIEPNNGYGLGRNLTDTLLILLSFPFFTGICCLSNFCCYRGMTPGRSRAWKICLSLAINNRFT
jgi:hypothetical protein